MPISDDGTTDYAATDSGVTALSDPDPSLEEILLRLIGEVSVVEQLVSETANPSMVVLYRLKTLKNKIAKLDLKPKKSNPVGFSSPAT